MSKKKNKYFQFKYLIILVLVIFIAIIAILSFTLREDRQENKVESLIKDIAIETQKIVTSPFKFVIDIINNYIELKDVAKENEILKTNIEELESLKALNTELEDEINKLKEELNIDYVLSDYEKMNATVVSRNTNYWYNILTIDKGSKNGVEIGMIVINSQGLIGKIVNVSNFTSDVRLITTSDTDNKISVTISNENSKVIGLINGYSIKDNTIEIEGVSNTETVSIGDTVYTSGLGGVFPSGILVGKVDSITVDSFGLAKIIHVKPSVSFDDINYVAVLKRSENN